MDTNCTANTPSESAYTTFGPFLRSAVALELLDSSSDAILMIHELRKAQEFHYFGLRAGKLSEQRSADRRNLRAFITQAYRHDAFGIAHWRRIASLVWRAHESVCGLRALAYRAEQKKRERAQGREIYRKNECERVRAFRARQKQLASRKSTSKVPIADTSESAAVQAPS